MVHGFVLSLFRLFTIGLSSFQHCSLDFPPLWFRLFTIVVSIFCLAMCREIITMDDNLRKYFYQGYNYIQIILLMAFNLFLDFYTSQQQVSMLCGSCKKLSRTSVLLYFSDVWGSLMPVEN
jgi:hypothetical protein